MEPACCPAEVVNIVDLSLCCVRPLPALGERGAIYGLLGLRGATRWLGWLTRLLLLLLLLLLVEVVGADRLAWVLPCCSLRQMAVREEKSFWDSTFVGSENKKCFCCDVMHYYGRTFENYTWKKDVFEIKWIITSYKSQLKLLFRQFNQISIDFLFLQLKNRIIAGIFQS